MQTKNQTPIVRKPFYAFMLLCLFLSVFDTGNTLTVQAQKEKTVKENIATSLDTEFTDPYWGFRIVYPLDWTLQNDPYKDFGWRIYSPDLEMDALGRPVSGGYLAVNISKSNSDPLQLQDLELYGATNTSSVTIVLSGIPAIEESGITSSGNSYKFIVFQNNGWIYKIKSMSEIKAQDNILAITDSIIESFQIIQDPVDYPYSFSNDLQSLAFSFPAIKLPFQPGSGKIGWAYLDGDHTGSNMFSFDFIECSGSVNGECNQGQTGQYILAPSDITLVYSGDYNNISGDANDYHIFEITNDSSNRLCLSLSHFYIKHPQLTVSKRVPRGTVIGQLSSYSPSYPHIHMGLWSTPISSGCAGSSRTAIAFYGSYQLDGVDYPPASGYSGRTVNSTNSPICAQATSLDINSQALSDCWGGESDNASFITDVTIPDNTTMSPGQTFTKTWRLNNTGSTTWGAGYSLVFTGGDQMGAPSSVSVTSTSPNNNVDISVNMVAPNTSGSYTGFWRMKNPQGQFFGQSVWLKINVNASTPTGQWHVEYFNDKNLGGRCYENYEDSTYIIKSWGNNAPANSCNNDNFSARFTKTINFNGGYYSFHCQHDDGCRIYIDEQLKLDAWWDSSFTGHDWGGNLSSGNHAVRIEFYDSGGEARLESFWSGPGFLPTGPSCNSDEWCASYYFNKDLSGTSAINRSEGMNNPNYDWGNGGIGYGFPNDNFSARWQRNLYFPAGQYRFHIIVDDGGRLYVNNQRVIDQWKDQGSTEYTVDLNLSSGTIPLSFEYYEGGGGAVAKLWWDTLQVYAPSTPLINSPVDRTVLVYPQNVIFDWSDTGDTYTFYFPGGSSSTQYDTTASNTTVNAPLAGFYEWFVVAHRNGQDSAPSAYTDLYIVPSAPQTISVATNSSTAVTVNWTTSLGGVDEYKIYRNNILVGTVNANTYSFQVTNLPCGNTSTYSVRAYKGLGTYNESPEKSSIGSTSSCSGTEDNYEENDTRATAYDLSTWEQTWLSTINGYGKQVDEDWYRIDVTPSFNRVLVDARFTHSQGDIDITLYDNSGTPVAFSNGVVNNEYIDFTVSPSGGFYYIKVHYGNQGNQYDLWWDDVQPSAATSTNITIGGITMGNYTLTPGTSQVLKYAVDGGPVVIGSGGGPDILASLNQWRRRPSTTVGWTGVAQTMALPVSLITNAYYFPRYDYSTPNALYNNLLIANVDTVSRDITITIGGVVRGTYTLGPSQSQYVNYPGVVGGPVVVSSVSGAKIVASLYELIRDPSLPGWNGQSEMIGLPATQLSDQYLIPLYFGAANPNTLNASLFIANVDTISTTIEIKIAGVSRGTYPLAANTGQVVKYALDGGPVEIRSTNGANIVASLNQWRRRPSTTVGWTGVAQTMALPVSLITDTYYFPRYDYSAPSALYNNLLIANVDTVSRDITITIGGVVRGTYTLAPSQSQYVNYSGLVGGPVVVSSVPGAKIVASLYELIRDPSAPGWNGQSEMMGLPATQLSDQYLIPLYFGAANPNTLNASIYIAVP